jgi:hypothetical protein
VADVRINPQQLDEDGLAPQYTGSLSASDTYLVNNDGRVFLHFKKTGAGDCTVTVETPGSVGGKAIADRTITVPATTGDVMAGPFPPSEFNQPGAHDLEFTLSEVTGLTVAALRL